MDTDLVLTIGIVLAVLSVPVLLAAWAESTAPRIGAVLVIVAIGMIATAVITRPGGYSLNEVPDVMLGVISRGLN
ncbi:hypothetical protein [Tabrizicola sp.]|uniref:hypothetical protein n=1 Tax=Tabrizicola sp. TaxID=2005166 RepID=UPI002609B828|nr:hypothetical protein [Tabrizicola sp.]MDM7932594.1 hypothetical protein [Tabrizicola sp.]